MSLYAWGEAKGRPDVYTVCVCVWDFFPFCEEEEEEGEEGGKLRAMSTVTVKTL